MCGSFFHIRRYNATRFSFSLAVGLIFGMSVGFWYQIYYAIITALACAGLCWCLSH